MISLGADTPPHQRTADSQAARADTLDTWVPTPSALVMGVPSSTGRGEPASGEPTPDSEGPPVATIEALVGQPVAIPCNISRWWPTGGQSPVLIVLWYKNSQLSSPIYTVDARQAPSLSKARHQIGAPASGSPVPLDSMGRTFAGNTNYPFLPAPVEAPAESDRGAASVGRLRFDVNHPNVPSLVISPVEQEDQGLYRCRVDFKKAPTQTYQVRLQLISE